MNRFTQIRTKKLADECYKRFKADKIVIDAIAKTDRESFVPLGFKDSAFKLDALPLANSQWISSPLTVTKMTHYLSPYNCDRVLEIGCGSGYQAGVLSHLFRGVFTIERIEKLLVQAKKTFRELNISNIHTRTDDGQNGWQQYAPYDRILFSATAKSIPPKLFEQLKDGGILVAPIQKGSKQVIVRFTKRGSSISQEELEECDFVPIVNGIKRTKDD